MMNLLRRFAWADDLARDARYAGRQLRRAPGFAAVVILTLAVGIGATSTIFSVVNGVLLRPLPFADPDRLVAIEGLSYKGEFVQLRDQARTVDVGAHSVDGPVNLTGSGEPVRLTASRVSAQLFPVLGVTPALGRPFTVEDTQPGAAPAVILGHALWQQRFGGATDIVGRQLTLDGVSRTVVGVTARDVRFPSAATQLWTPLVIREGDPIDLWAQSASMVGRMRAGVTPRDVTTEIQAHVPRMRGMFPWKMPADYGAAAAAVPLHARIVGDVRQALLVLLAAVCAVLAIVCVNVANLQLARGLTRQREMAVRAAIGAGRSRLFRQMMAESLTLAVVAGAIGIGLSYAALGAVTAWLPAEMPRAHDVAIDWRVLLFASGASLASGALFGLWPALRVSAARLEPALREAGRSTAGSPAQRRTARVLVAAEIALAVVLVTSAALLVRSFWNLTATDPGFQTERLVSATVAPPQFRYKDAAARRAFVGQLLERLRATPGITRASAATAMPLGAPAYGAVFSIEGRPDPATQSGEWPLAHVTASVDAEYFTTMGTPLVEGRGFTGDDRQGGLAVAVVSRSLAAQYWPGQSAVGARIRFPGGRDWVTVVGVIADVKWNGLTEENNRALYRPLVQGSPGAVSVVVRTGGDPALVAASFKGIVAALDADTPVSDIQTAEALVGAAAAKPRFTASLLAIFAGVALFLGAIGVFGVLAHGVSQRRQEFGVRIALGARTGDLLRQVLGQGLAISLAGVMLGLALAFVATRALDSLLFGVTPGDPLVFTGVAVTLMVVALLASIVPALRASRVNPVTALRGE